MKSLDPNLQRERWLSRALCRRYAVVAFISLVLPPLKNQLGENRTIWWAFGCLIKGECEVLGAWNLDAKAATTTEVFGNLHNRGVEFVRCGLGDLANVEAGFLATFRMAAVYPSIEQSLASAIGFTKPRHRAAMASLLHAAINESGAGRATVSEPEISSEDLRQKYPGILERWDETAAAFEPLFSLADPYRRFVRSVDRAAIGMQERLVKAMHRHGPFADSAEAFDFVVDWLVRADLRLMRDAEAKELAREALVSRSGRFAAVSGGAAGTPALA